MTIRRSWPGHSGGKTFVRGGRSGDVLMSLDSAISAQPAPGTAPVAEQGLRPADQPFRLLRHFDVVIAGRQW